MDTFAALINSSGDIQKQISTTCFTDCISVLKQSCRKKEITLSG